MHAHCVIFGLFPFGRRSRGHRGRPQEQNYSSISMGKSMYPIIPCGVSLETTPLPRANHVKSVCGVSLETTPLTRANDVKSVCVHSARWHTARYNTH